MPPSACSYYLRSSMSCPPTSHNRSTVGNNTASVAPTNGRRKRGVLGMLPSLPLDILCEIFCFVHPADLLAVARTSKAFRFFLLRRSAAFIWRSARRNVDGLPEPPSDVSEVQYASLVFGLACHYKGCDGKARDTIWHLRIRSCVSCRPKHQPIKVNDNGDYRAVCAMLHCIPTTLEQYMPCGPFLSSKGNPVKGFQKHHMKAFKDALEALPLSERQVYLDHCRQTNEVVGQFASAGVAWQLKAKGVRIMQLRNKRTVRAEIIQESLVAAGFGEEIDYFGWDRIRKHPLISNTRPVAPEARPGIVDQLREYMLGWRELRMEERVYALRRQVFVDAWSQFTTAHFYNAPVGCPYLPLPPTATIGFSESVNSVIRQPGLMSDKILIGQLYAALPQACDYILDWHRTIRRGLASLLPDYRLEDNDEVIHSRLKLATSVFRCSAGRNCRSEGRTLTYPEILFHPCFTLATHGNGYSTKDPWSIANQKACLAMGSGPWKCNGRVQVHPRQYVVNKVLLCCGKDPGSTTATEMDGQDPRLACQGCAIRDGMITFMSWRRAVQHDITFHPNSTGNHLWVADRKYRIRIDRLECPNLRPFSNVSGDTLGDYSTCLLCPPRIPSWNTRFGFGDLIDHIKNKHGVSTPAFGKDYMFDTNITPVYLDPVILGNCKMRSG